MTELQTELRKMRDIIAVGFLGLITAMAAQVESQPEAVKTVIEQADILAKLFDEIDSE